MNVFVYVLDSLRADHTSCYGYDRETTPNLDTIAEEGIRFKHGYTVSTWTKQAAASIWTGTYPTSTKVTTVYDRLPEDVPTLPAALDDRGFTVAGTTATGHVSPDYGFDKGFDHFHVDSDITAERKNELTEEFGGDIGEDYNFVPPSSDRLQARILNKFDECDSDDFFGLIWSLDTHDPFFVTDENTHFSEDGRFLGSGRDEDISELINVYDDMIRTADQHLGTFVNELQRRGEYEDTLLLVLGDHGEAFGEHGNQGHTGLPYREQIKIPFVLKPPKSSDTSFNPSRPAQLTDVFPTVLNFLGIPVPDHLQGESLGNPLERDDQTDRVVYTETQFNYSRDTYESVQRGQDKLIVQTPSGIRPFVKIIYQMLINAQLQARLSNMEHSYDLVSTIKSEVAYLLERDESKLQLFNLAQDPHETENLVEESTNRDKLSELRQDLKTVREANEALEEKIEEQTFTRIDADTRQQLEDIGYKL